MALLRMESESPSIGSLAAAGMNDCLVSAVFQAVQHTPYLPLAHADLGCRLLLW
jgi:hypothetical protein